MISVIKQLIVPVGIVWLLLITMTVIAWRRRGRRDRFLTSITLVLYSLLGNGWIGGWLQSSLAIDDGTTINSISEPFDAVAVLGGCATATDDGVIYLNSSGDRLAVAARLYHREQTRFLVAAGGVESDELAPMDIGKSVLQELGVPAEAVVSSEGSNTTAELAEFKTLSVGKGWDRLAIVTDWWHLRRVKTWADRNGLSATLIASGGTGEVGEFRWDYHIVPQGSGFEASARFITETVGRVMTSIGIR